MRIVTLNLWGLQPPLERRLAMAERQLRALSPDVVCLQEVRALDGQGGRHTGDELAARLGMHVVFAPAVRDEGLAILSRTPIAEHRVLALPEARPDDARILLSARLDPPVWVHTTHLHYRLDDGLAREAQVVAIDAAVRALGREKEDPMHVLCGDLNCTPDSDELRFLRGLTTLAGRRTHWQDAWQRVHGTEGGGITWSSQNPHAHHLARLDLDRRIDYVLVASRRSDGKGTVRDCRVALTDIDDGVAASDHWAVVAEVDV